MTGADMWFFVIMPALCIAVLALIGYVEICVIDRPPRVKK